MLLAYRLVRLIEQHSDTLARDLLQRVQSCSTTAGFVTHVPSQELQQRVNEIYRNLGDWLLGKTELDIEQRYREIGARRAMQGVPFSQVASAIILTKDTLWDFLMKETIVERPVEIFGELEMLQLLDQFFDRAIFYAALGHEEVTARQPQAARYGD